LVIILLIIIPIHKFFIRLSGTKREFPRKHFNQIISEKKSEEEADSNDGSKNDQETDGEQNPQLHIDPEQHKPPETMDDEMDHLVCVNVN
jgi:hypothetical protein